MEDTLLNAPLFGASSVKDCSLAATTLQQAAKFELSQGVSILQVSSLSLSVSLSLSLSFSLSLSLSLSLR